MTLRRMVRHSGDRSPGGNQADNNTKSQPPDVSTRKKNLTLDFQAVQNMNHKRIKLDIHKNSAPVLSSPDIKKLKLKSPELESLIMQQNPMNGATPTPTTQGLLFPKLVTEEQEIYARGFVDALNELHYSDSSQGPNQAVDISNSSSNGSITYTDLDPQMALRHTVFPSIGSNYNPLSPLGIVIKDEPQTVPSISDSPNLSPIDMETQEEAKLERKRQRNRVAASKCRKRKLERISRLEDKVRLLKGENTDLSTFVAKLKEQVCHLKRQVLEHVNSGCHIMSYC